jgi:hypothetical protein
VRHAPALLGGLDGPDLMVPLVELGLSLRHDDRKIVFTQNLSQKAVVGV